MNSAIDVARRADLSGKNILITGASSGLGAEAARALAYTGANIIITARNMDAGKDVLADMRDNGAGAYRLVQLDLGDPEDVRRCAASVTDIFGEVDVLIANAGVAQTPADRLSDGLEVRFVTNYLGHFLLAHALLGPLSARGARLVMLGSAGHKGRPVNLDDLSWRKREQVDQRAAYGESKSAISLFAAEATRRWHARGIFANCVLPGSVVTGLQRHHTPERMADMLRIGGQGGQSVFTSAEEGAATTVWAACAPELERVGGLVLESCGPASISGPYTHPYRGYELHSIDSETARRLWTATVDLIAHEKIPFAPE